MLRAAALAVAVIAAFLGVMYLRFRDDAVSPSASTRSPSPISLSERCKNYARVPRPPQCGGVTGIVPLLTARPQPTSAAPAPEVREQLTVLRAGHNIGLASNRGRIVFVRANDIWVKDLDYDREYRLTDDGRSTAPRWSGDNRSLLFALGTWQPMP